MLSEFHFSHATEPAQSFFRLWWASLIDDTPQFGYGDANHAVPAQNGRVRPGQLLTCLRKRACKLNDVSGFHATTPFGEFKKYFQWLMGGMNLGVAAA